MQITFMLFIVEYYAALFWNNGKDLHDISCELKLSHKRYGKHTYFYTCMYTCAMYFIIGDDKTYDTLPFLWLGWSQNPDRSFYCCQGLIHLSYKMKYNEYNYNRQHKEDNFQHYIKVLPLF